MEQKTMREYEAKCVQEQPPWCTASCPVHIDARGIAAAVRQEDYKAGFTLLHKMVPFPGIISRICDQPCQRACKRKEIDEAIEINALEKICVDNNNTAAKFTAIAVKEGRVAIVGAGLSGLTAAVELAKKGYQVTVFEAADRLGGRIREVPEAKLPQRIIDADFLPMKHLAIEIRLHTKVGNYENAPFSFDSLLTAYDAVYLAIGCRDLAVLNLGLELDSQGNVMVDKLTLRTSNPKVLAGGSLILGPDNQSPITSVSHGKIAANSIDRLLSGVSLTAGRENEGPIATALYTNIQGVEPKAAVKFANGIEGYTSKEALEEANRCLLCQCLECVKVCQYLEHYRGHPKRYVREVYNNLSIVMGVRHANNMINACNLCGLCEQVCPGNLNMGEICQEARRTMVQKGKMPPSTHDFALRDMKFSTGQDFSLAKHQPGFSASSAVFFPGCQLSASLPEHVQKLYQFLCEKIPGGVGLMLSCCGVPADWSGREELFQENIHSIACDWRKLGSPRVITGCPTCYRIFKREFPEMVVNTIWTELEELGLPPAIGERPASLQLAVHDTCTTRHEAALQQSVRGLLRQLGHEVAELPYSHETTECCGYGGLMLFANKDIAHKMIEKRVGESELAYLTYCAMCRDNFASQGKQVYHLLDLIFASKADLARGKGPGYSDRQENRAKLKAVLLKEVWGEAVEGKAGGINLIIPEKVQDLLEDRMILRDDVAKVIAYAESTGNKFKNTANDIYIAYYKPVSVTYWVEYTPQEDGFMVHNAYSHRLEIKGG